MCLDPYMHDFMSDAKSYVAPRPLGEVMIGATVRIGTESSIDGFQVGDYVGAMFGRAGHQSIAVSFIMPSL